MSESEAQDRGSAEAVEEATWSLGAVAKLTGLTSHTLRAWENRYQVVTPLRTAGGTRRYRESEVRRLRLLQRATALGHPISQLARLSDAAVEQLLGEENVAEIPIGPLVQAANALDAEGLERGLSVALAALGPRRFVHLVALPLIAAVGDGWQRGKLCVAGEHLVSAVLRNLLGAALRPMPVGRGAPKVIFTTVSGDRHELGILCAAVLVGEAGASVVYLGPDLPVEEVEHAVERVGPAAVVLGFAWPLPEGAQEQLDQLRERLDDAILLWIGGAGARELSLPAGAEFIQDLEVLEQRASLLWSEATS